MATKAEKILKSAEQRLASVQFELGRIKAALWLVDQIEVGEFYYLSNRGAHGRPPCWLSHLGGMTNTDLHGHLFHMAMREIADALKDADTAAKDTVTAPRLVEVTGGA